MQTCSCAHTCAWCTLFPHSFSLFFKSPLRSQLRPYLHSDVCSCVIYLCCRLIFQSPGSSAAVSKTSRRRRWRKRRRRRRAAVVWVSGRLASQHRWRFVWILPRERGSREREGGQKEWREGGKSERQMRREKDGERQKSREWNRGDRRDKGGEEVGKTPHCSLNELHLSATLY